MALGWGTSHLDPGPYSTSTLPCLPQEPPRSLLEALLFLVVTATQCSGVTAGRHQCSRKISTPSPGETPVYGCCSELCPPGGTGHCNSLASCLFPLRAGNGSYSSPQAQCPQARSRHTEWVGESPAPGPQLPSPHCQIPGPWWSRNMCTPIPNLPGKCPGSPCATPPPSWVYCIRSAQICLPLLLSLLPVLLFY